MPKRKDVFAGKGVLSLLVDAEMASTIREDLEYQRSRDREQKGRLIAALLHAFRLVATVGPLIIDTIIGGFIMIGNSIRMASRNLAKHKGFSFINIAGLALGMTACLFLVLWVQDERSFDLFHKSAAAIFRVDLKWETFRSELTPYPLGPAVERNIPEVKNTARQASLGVVVLRAGEKTFYESRSMAVDPSFLRIFSFPLLQGNPESALRQPHSLILTESQARKYFGGENPLGKTVTMDGQFDFTVAGVMKDVPANSTIQYDILVPLEFMREFGWYIDNWGSVNVTTWLELQDRKQAEVIEKKSPHCT